MESTVEILSMMVSVSVDGPDIPQTYEPYYNEDYEGYEGYDYDDSLDYVYDYGDY